jgi:hypothetical protein
MEIMDLIVTVIVIGFVGWIVLEFLLPKKDKVESENKIEPAKEIDSDFVTGLTVEKIEEVKPAPVASLEPVVEEVKKVETAVVEEAKEAAAELAKEIDQVLEEVKVTTKKVRTKAKAIEAVIEEKAEQLEAAVKKTKAKAKKNG